MKHLKFTFIGLVLLLSYSCSSSDDSNDDTPDNTNYAELILGKWQYVTVLINGVQTQEPCQIDVSYTFDNDGTYGIVLGERGLCAPTGDTGIYEVVGDKVFVNTTQGNAQIEFSIETLNENTFIYEERFLSEGFPDDVRLISCEKIAE